MTDIIKEIFNGEYRALAEVRHNDEEHQKQYKEYVQAEDELIGLLNKLDGIDAMGMLDKLADQWIKSYEFECLDSFKQGIKLGFALAKEVNN